MDRPNVWHREDTDLEKVYSMDRASIAAAEALEVEPGEEVIDLCAAPGGKSLILIEKMRGAGSITLNDSSRTRMFKLRKVLKDHVPADVLASVRVTQHDASRWGLHEQDRYDRVLLDAPCSSEQHVIASEAALAKWSPSRSRQLAQRQYALLCSALQIVRPGGRIVYSTCSIAPAENDGVIAKLMKKRSGQFQAVWTNCDLGTKTEHGRIVLPDTDGCGPIYFAVLEKSVPVG